MQDIWKMWYDIDIGFSPPNGHPETKRLSFRKSSLKAGVSDVSCSIKVTYSYIITLQLKPGNDKKKQPRHNAGTLSAKTMIHVGRPTQLHIQMSEVHRAFRPKELGNMQH
jgi:hypothetical protein